MKHTLKTLAIIAAMLPFAVTSCEKPQTEEKNPQLSIVTEDATVPYTGDDVTVEFICSGDWTATLQFTGDEEWAAISGNASGNGSAAITVAVSENSGQEDRTATLTVTSGNLSDNLTIKQEGKKLNITFKHPSLAFTQEQLDKIKAAYNAGAPTVKKTMDFVMTRATNALKYDPETVSTADKQENSDMELLYKRAKGPAMQNIFLILASHMTDDTEMKEQYLTKAVEVMYSWASALQNVEYPVGNEENKTGAGMYLSRVMFPFFVGYDYVKNTEYITAEQKAVIESWFRHIVDHIRASMNTWENNDYFNRQYWQNHLAAHMWGLLSIGYALDDPSLVQFAIDSPENPRDFYELIQGCIFMEGDEPCARESASAPAVQTGEVYDRYRHDTGPMKGLQYSSLTLQVLSSAARICQNNGIDMYAYTAPTGENLRLAYEFYADFYITKDCSIKGGYYSGEEDRLGKAGDHIGLFELGYNAYPDSEKIKEVINSIPDRGANDDKTNLHDNLGYLRLYSIDVDSSN